MMVDELAMGDIVRFLWTVRLPIVIGVVTGAVLCGALALLTRDRYYVSNFLVDLDRSSLPAITDREKLTAELNSLLQRPRVMRPLISSVLAPEDAASAEQRAIVHKTLLNEVDTFIIGKSRNSALKLNEERRLVKASPGPLDDSFLVTLSLPVQTPTATVGTKLIAFLNEQIRLRNEDEVSSIQRIAEERIKEEQDHILKSQLTLRTKGIEAESEALKVRSDLASIEYEIVSLARSNARVLDFLTFTQSFGILGLGKTLQASEVPNVMVNSDKQSDFSARIERILNMISALQIEGRLEEDVANRIRQKIAQVSHRHKSVQSRLVIQTEIENDLQKRLRVASIENVVARDKVFLPLLQLNAAYYESLTSQASAPGQETIGAEIVYSRKVSYFIIAGMVLGGIVALIGALLLQALRGGPRSMSGRTEGLWSPTAHPIANPPQREASA